MRHLITMAILAGLAAQSLHVHAEPVERQVWGEVTQVVPITRPVSTPLPPQCTGPRPRNADLVSLLSWDLNPDCMATHSSETVGYQVSYRWDDRSYSVKLPEHPGTRIPLTLRLR